MEATLDNDKELTDGWKDFQTYIRRITPLYEEGTTMKYYNIDNYLKNVSGGYYGDDLLLSVSRVFSDFYNYYTIHAANKLIGHTYTKANKTGEIDNKFDSKTDANILKRNIVYDKDYFRYIAPLNLEVIYDIPNWVKKGEDIKEQTILNIDTALRELTLHGEELYNDFKVKYQDILADLRLSMFFPEFKKLKERVMTGEDAPCFF